MPPDCKEISTHQEQFGLLMIKPDGIRAGMDVILLELLNSQGQIDGNGSLFFRRHSGEEVDRILYCIFQNYSDEERNVLIPNLAKLRLEQVFFRDTSENNTIWEINYRHYETGYLKRLLLESVCQESMIFVISYLGEYDLVELLHLIKGKTHLVIPRYADYLAADQTIRAGTGIRGLQTQRAACISRAHLAELSLQATFCVRKEIITFLEHTNSVLILRTELPRSVQNFILPFMPYKDNYELVSDTLHSSDSMDIVFDTLLELYHPSENVLIKLSGYHTISSKIRFLIDHHRPYSE